tara:strand:+ start:299 stop:802 length:504 start_codon:yes stop_codon:yes gene_type:complete
MVRISQYLFIFSLGMSGHLAIAQPATYEDNVFNIPQGAALVNGVPTYYNNIQFVSDIEGNFTLIAAEQRNLVAVETVVVNIAESLPLQVSITVSGNKSIPCVELQAPAIFRNGTVFTIALAETVLGPAETCIAVLDPFETTIELNVAGLSSGNYSVSVNGIEAEFAL